MSIDDIQDSITVNDDKTQATSTSRTTVSTRSSANRALFSSRQESNDADFIEEVIDDTPGNDTTDRLGRRIGGRGLLDQCPHCGKTSTRSGISRHKCRVDGEYTPWEIQLTPDIRIVRSVSSRQADMAAAQAVRAAREREVAEAREAAEAAAAAIRQSRTRSRPQRRHPSYSSPSDSPARRPPSKDKPLEKDLMTVHSAIIGAFDSFISASLREYAEKRKV